MIRARHAFLLVPLLLLGHSPTADAASKAKKSRKAKPVAVISVVTACGNFYNYANDDWLKSHPAPTEGSVSAFDTLRINARTNERALLEEMGRAADDDAGHALGAVWNDGMNEAAIEAAGAKPMQPLFTRIAAIRKNKDLASAIADLHGAGIPVLFNFAADADANDRDRTIGYANQGGLGLPDPAYYTRTDAETRDVLGRYRAYIQTILQLSGTPADQVSVQSGWVLSMEMQLAQNSLPLEQLRDPANGYHPVTVVELQKAYPHLAFSGFLKAQNVRDDHISLAHTGFFAAADGMLANVPVEQWQAYLRFHVASAMAPYLSRAFQDAHFQMYDHLLGDQPLPQDHADQVIDAVNRVLGPVMGHAYAQRYLPASTRNAAVHVADALRAAMKSSIAGNSWMDDTTRAAARAKLDKLRIEIGEPSQVPSTAGLVLGNGYASDMLALAAWQHRREMATIDQPSVERDWPAPAQVPNLSYDLIGNRLIVTAAMLQPPVFDAGMDAAAQYGSLGSLIGHQLHNAFGGKGRSIDAEGRLRDWWTPAVLSAYEQRVAPIVAQFNAYHVDATTTVNGGRTRDENLADLGGVELAWSAFKATTPVAPAAKPGASTPERRFFEAYAHVWARSSAPATMLAWAATSVQPPAKVRVNGVLADVPEFAKAFACKAGQPMVGTAPLTIWH